MPSSSLFRTRHAKLAAMSWPAALMAGQRGVVALEFGLISLALIMLIAGILHIGFCLYAQVVLDHAAITLASQFEQGKTQGVADPNADPFRSLSVCPALQGMLACSAVTVMNYPVADYYNQTSSTAPNPGSVGSTMVLKLLYTVPFSTWPVLNAQGSSNSLVVTSTIPYINEIVN